MVKTFKTSDLPKSLKTLLPRGYRKHSVLVVVSDYTTPYLWYWENGSKYDWEHFLEGKPQPLCFPGYPFNGKVEPIKLEENSVVVQSGISSGKPSMATLHIHSAEYYELDLSLATR